jgi:23S rRNA (adenine2503-C2)-methyltransferase
MNNIYSLSPNDITEQIKEWGVPKFRAKQLIDWLYGKRVASFSQMGNIPNTLKELLETNYKIGAVDAVYTVESPSGDAVKFGIKLDDGEIIESVLLRSKKRRTLCVSSQVGCGLACSFCETGKMGLIRNLSVGEIILQLIIASNYLEKEEKRLTNLVFMGMGEALSNFDNFYKAIGIITHDNCFAIGNRKITVSTAGVIPSIKKMIDNKMTIELAISLNSSSDEERDKLMPINLKYPISDLLVAAREYAQFRGRPVTFEYVLVKGENDSDDAAKRLIKLFRGYPAKINLIPLNDCTTDGLKRPSEERIDQFSNLIHRAGITVTVRRSGGQEIDGACGQLANRLKKENEG